MVGKSHLGSESGKSPDPIRHMEQTYVMGRIFSRSHHQLSRMSFLYVLGKPNFMEEQISK